MPNKKDKFFKNKPVKDETVTISNAKILFAKSTESKSAQISAEKVNLKKTIDEAKASCDNEIASAENALKHALDSNFSKYNDLIANKDGEIATKIAILKEELMDFKSSRKKDYDNFAAKEKSKCAKIIANCKLKFAKKKTDAERLYSDSVMSINKKYN